LPTGTGATVHTALEALACKQLGHPNETGWKGLRSVVLRRMLEVDDDLDDKQIFTQLVRKVTGTPKGGLEPLRKAILRRWISGSALPHADSTTNGPVPERREPELGEFAATVKAAARDCPTGRFGDNKVFISHVWRHLQREPNFPKLDLGAFKQRLNEASRAGLLRLSRADLIEAMDPTDVRESDTPYLNTTSHFILLEREQP
jgi:hypothetical protein